MADSSPPLRGSIVALAISYLASLSTSARTRLRYDTTIVQLLRNISRSPGHVRSEQKMQTYPPMELCCLECDTAVRFTIIMHLIKMEELRVRPEQITMLNGETLPTEGSSCISSTRAFLLCEVLQRERRPYHVPLSMPALNHTLNTQPTIHGLL